MDHIEKAKQTLVNCLNVKRSERLLILCDGGTIDIAQIFFEAAEKVCMSPLLMEIPMGRFHGDEPPRIAAGVMIDSDVIVAPTTYSITYSNATRTALANGARVATMPGITMEMLEMGGLEANYRSMAKRIRKVGRMFTRSRNVHLTSESGTDVRMSIAGREWITDDTGLCYKRGSITNLPAGELFIAPKETSINGHLVIDGVFTGPIKGKIELMVKNGNVESLKGSVETRKLMARSSCVRTVCKLGLGMNPKSRIIGNILEDQKTLGTVNIGLGDNSSFGGNVVCEAHYDAMILKPTLVIDRKTLIEDGRFVLDV